MKFTTRLPIHLACMTAVIGTAIAGDPGTPSRLPGTMNFRNVTASNVVQTVPETSRNEKEVEFGDFDKDGDLDAVLAVALSDFQERRNKLYRNDGGVMQEVSGAPIIPGFAAPAPDDVSRNALMRDFDDDGWLDIIIVNDSNNGAGGITRYFANKHPKGVFSHFEEETFRLNGAGGAACGAVARDLDGNDTIDLFIGNYPFDSQDTLYFNNGAGIFTDVTDTHVPMEQDYTVDVSAADMNGDGRPDLLIASHFDPQFIAYNNNLDAGSGPGDFKYAGSRQQFPSTNFEPAMEPADFNLDGKMDIYFSNWGPGRTDKVLQNSGNDKDGNKATFTTEITMPPSVSVTESRKATVSDFNRDGKPDLVVMGENRRPVILRNTSVNGATSFVEWTPAPAFPNGSTHAGWHAAAGDVNGDNFDDIFVGGTNNDHLFHNVPGVELDEAIDGTTIPVFHNLDPVAVIGDAGVGEADMYMVTGIPSGGTVSAVLNSSSDVTLEIRTAGDALLHSSERGGTGIEEALQFTAPLGSLRFKVILNALGENVFTGDPDVDRDGDGLTALMEFFLGTSDTDRDSGTDAIQTRIEDIDIKGAVAPYLVTEFDHKLTAEDALVLVEVSDDTVTWTQATLVSTTESEGTISEKWRAASPLGAMGRQFIRLRVELADAPGTDSYVLEILSRN